jgi:hypothetical protein
MDRDETIGMYIQQLRSNNEGVILGLSNTVMREVEFEVGRFKVSPATSPNLFSAAEPQPPFSFRAGIVFCVLSRVDWRSPLVAVQV